MRPTDQETTDIEKTVSYSQFAGEESIPHNGEPHEGAPWLVKRQRERWGGEGM